MSVRHALLALLSEGPKYGLQLRQEFEARTGLSVRHSQLVRFLFAHVTRPPYFLVMELLRGESLRRRLRRDKSLDVPTVFVPPVKRATDKDKAGAQPPGS